MRIATWNLNNRVGKVKFRPEAANAATTLGADVLVFNEYYPKEHKPAFERVLCDAGWLHQLISGDTGERANRILIASRHRLVPLQHISLPKFDNQFPSNVLCVEVPSQGISIVGVRIPWYEQNEISLVASSWDWLESTALGLSGSPSVILGDLNVGLATGRSRGGEHFRRILQSGWHRAIPGEGFSFFSETGRKSEIDHILGTSRIRFNNVQYVTKSDEYQLAGGFNAISDHAALLTDVTFESLPS